MDKKLRTILSELATDVKALSLDDHISFRYLHSKFSSKLDYFLRLEAKSREIFKDFTLWKSIDCIELVEVATNPCGFIDACKTVKRSSIKIPEAYNTNWGQLIKVLTIDGSVEFKPIKSSDLKDYLNREYGGIPNVYWMENQRIYIPNTTLDSVKALIIPKNSIEVDKMNCEENPCASILDGIINYPEYLITLAKQEVLKEISGVYVRMVEDEKGDDNTNRKN